MPLGKSECKFSRLPGSGANSSAGHKSPSGDPPVRNEGPPVRLGASNPLRILGKNLITCHLHGPRVPFLVGIPRPDWHDPCIYFSRQRTIVGGEEQNRPSGIGSHPQYFSPDDPGTPPGRTCHNAFPSDTFPRPAAPSEQPARIIYGPPQSSTRGRRRQSSLRNELLRRVPSTANHASATGLAPCENGSTCLSDYAHSMTGSTDSVRSYTPRGQK